MKNQSNKLNQNRKRRERATWCDQQGYTANRSKKIRTDSSLISWYLDLVASDLIKSNFNERLRVEAVLQLLGSGK